MIIQQLGRKTLNDLKNKCLLGDYIIAKRLQPNIYRRDDIGLSSGFLGRSLRWNITPQGPQFWLGVCNRLRW